MGLSTEAELCNISLGLIGVSIRIQSLSDNEATARACKDNYSQARDLALESFEWTFAEQTAVLALSTEVRTGWTYTYALPGNCMVPRRIDDGSGNRSERAVDKTPFRTMLNDAGNGMLLVTDQQNAVLVYTASVAITALFSAHFTECVAHLLAAKLANVVKKDPKLGLSMMQSADFLLKRAGAFDRNVGQLDPRPDSVLLTGR